MKKRIVKAMAVGAAAVMMFGMAACGSSKGTSGAGAAADTSAAKESGDSTAGDFETVEDGKLHMATNAVFAPYEMVADDGSFEGIDVEIADAIADKLGLELVVDDMDFSAVLTAVQNGKADMAMAGMTVSEERKQNVDFTDSYSTGVQVIIVPEGSDIQTVDDLANDKMIGCQEGTTGYNYCSADVEEGGYGADHVIAYTNGAMAVQALIGGKVDCVVIDNEPAKSFVANNEGLKILDTEFTVEDYAIGIAKDNTALLDAVNGALKELIEDGTVQTIVDKYINAE